MYVGKDIIPKIAVDKAARGVFVANNIFYFENEPIMVLGDQYKPDVGGGSQIKNVFFEKEIEINYLETDSKGLWQGF